MIQKTFLVFAVSFFGLVACAVTVALFRNVYFVWVNDTRALVGQYVLAGLLLGVLVAGSRFAARRVFGKERTHGA